MTAYGIQYRENGLVKNRGFKYRDQFEKALVKLMNKTDVIIYKLVVNFELQEML